MNIKGDEHSDVCGIAYKLSSEKAEDNDNNNDNNNNTSSSNNSNNYNDGIIFNIVHDEKYGWEEVATLKTIGQPLHLPPEANIAVSIQDGIVYTGRTGVHHHYGGGPGVVFVHDISNIP